MPYFLLYESSSISRLGESSVFSSLETLSNYIEPIDVDNNEYFLCDITGQFYSISTTSNFNLFLYKETILDQKLARELFIEHLASIGKSIDRMATIEEISEMLKKAPSFYQ